MTLTPETLFWLLLGAALLSSLVTLLVIWAVMHFRVGPELERRLDERMREAADAIEQRIRERLLGPLGGRSGEVLRERARDLARTGIGIFGGRRPPGESDDSEDDFSR